MLGQTPMKWGGLPPCHSYSTHINLVSSQELEKAPLNKSLLLSSCFLHFFRSAWALGTIFRTMGCFGCIKPFESRTSGILSRRKKKMKQPRQLGERTDRTTGALQLTHPSSHLFSMLFPTHRSTYSRTIAIARAKQPPAGV